MSRISWNIYYLQLCNKIAERATCDRRHVGAIITRDNEIVSTGYNGSLPGLAHCDDPDEFWYCSKCKNKTTKEPTYLALFGPTCDNTACKGITNVVKMNGNHDILNSHCVKTVHAEINAIARAARKGAVTLNATMYCNTFPCWHCFKTIVSSGISKVIYSSDYPSEGTNRVLEAVKLLSNFELRQIQLENK